MGNPQCCSRECAAGCVGPNDNQCTVSRYKFLIGIFCMYLPGLQELQQQWCTYVLLTALQKKYTIQ